MCQPCLDMLEAHPRSPLVEEAPMAGPLIPPSAAGRSPEPSPADQVAPPPSRPKGPSRFCVARDCGCKVRARWLCQRHVRLVRKATAWPKGWPETSDDPQPRGELLVALDAVLDSLEAPVPAPRTVEAVEVLPSTIDAAVLDSLRERAEQAEAERDDLRRQVGDLRAELLEAQLRQPGTATAAAVLAEAGVRLAVVHVGLRTLLSSADGEASAVALVLASQILHVEDYLHSSIERLG